MVDGPSRCRRRGFASVDVQSSLGRSLRAVADLGTWQLERGADGSVHATGTGRSPPGRVPALLGGRGTKSEYTWDMPATLRVIERATDAELPHRPGRVGRRQPAGSVRVAGSRPDLTEPALDERARRPGRGRPRYPHGERATGRVHTGEGRRLVLDHRAGGPETRGAERPLAGRTAGVSLHALRRVRRRRPHRRFARATTAGTVSYTATVDRARLPREVGQPPSSSSSPSTRAQHGQLPGLRPCKPCGRSPAA